MWIFWVEAEYQIVQHQWGLSVCRFDVQVEVPVAARAGYCGSGLRATITGIGTGPPRIIHAELEGKAFSVGIANLGTLSRCHATGIQMDKVLTGDTSLFVMGITIRIWFDVQVEVPGGAWG